MFVLKVPLKCRSDTDDNSDYITMIMMIFVCDCLYFVSGLYFYSVLVANCVSTLISVIS